MNKNKDNSLHIAVKKNNNKLFLESIMTQEIDSVNLRLNTPLHLSVIFNRKSMFDELLEKGADPSIKNDAEYLPVHSAILNGYEKMFDALIKHSDSIDTDLLLDLEFHISTEFVQKVLYFDFNIKYSHDLVRMKKLVAYMLQCNNNNLLWFLFYSDVYEAKIFAYVAQYLGVNITKCMK